MKAYLGCRLCVFTKQKNALETSEQQAFAYLCLCIDIALMQLKPTHSV